MIAWTDYPIIQLGDIAGEKAPIREVEVLYYDGDKRCRIRVDGIEEDVKTGYIYQNPGRYGEVPSLSEEQLISLTKDDLGIE
jgi:hypothetical protein